MTGSSATGKTATFSFIRECMAINQNILCLNYLDYNKNQYLIIGRNPRNLFATKENLFELVSRKKGEQTEFRIEPYL